MAKIAIRFLLQGCLLLLGTILITCGKDSPTNPQPPATPPPAVPVPTRIVITPPSATLNSIGQTIQLSARVLDQNGAVISGAPVTWTSSDAGVATVSNQGLVTAVQNGSAVITARSGSVAGTVSVAVAQTARRIVIEPQSATLMSIGETVQLAATVLDQNGQPVAGADVTWQSSDTGVAIIDDKGLVTAVSEGSTRITARAGNASASMTVSVVQTGAGIVIQPETALLVSIGGTVELTASVLDQNEQPVEGAVVTWQSSDETVAMVSTRGLVTAVANGTAHITARSGDVTQSIEVRVMQEPASIVIEPESTTLMSIGETVQFAATVLDRNQHAVPGISVVWNSSDSSVATVTDGGLVTAIANGSVQIAATYGVISASAQVKVMIPSPDRAALITLFNALDGPNWTNNENWLSNLPVRDWYGVATDDQAKVIGLDLSNNNLKGQLPPVLAELIHLRSLILTNNAALAGSIPKALNSLALNELHTDGTGLCAPSDVGFQSWLDAISDSRVVTCISNPDEIEALVAFYYQTNGPNWTNGTNWLSNAPLGAWHGVETDETGSVIELTLDNNNISGSIPPEIGQLSNLQILRLNGNDLFGSIPAELGQLKKVWYLSVSGNQLSGFIPPELGEMTSLNGLYLNLNRLSGPIPAELGQIARLRNLSLASNRLSGTIPSELERLKNLDFLELGWNFLSGPIPPELGNISTVRLLFLDGNRLSGPIPPELGQLNNLEELRLQENLLTGSLPSELGNLAKLRRLNLSNNRALSGSVPRSFLNLTIGGLDLRGTQLCVPLDDEFESWLSGISGSQVVRCGDSTVAALTSLYNATDGPNWSNSENWLSQQPSGDWYGVSTDNTGQITGLDLADNNLNGPLPPILSILTALRSLNLSGNVSLTGPLPRSFLKLNLEILHLAGTNLCAPSDTEFQSWVRGISDAKVAICGSSSPDREALVAFYNGTNGPNWNENTNWLSNESLNRWRGVRTDSEGRVTGISLTGINLSGRLPPEIGQLQHLVGLDLYNNSISGSIPPELGNLSKLRSLNLNGNDLYGRIPPELGQLTGLVNLSLSGNELTGGIPPELGQLTNLIDLSLSGNELTGSIPPELGDLKKLDSMFFSNNSLTGAIPPELGQLERLRDLVLFTNRLSGPLPPEIGNLKNLVSLSIWDNQLTGHIPAELGRLSNLTGMFLSNNRLTGPIPPELGNLHLLISLRIDSNRITGPIPPELGQLGRLGELFLQKNLLSGAVPSELGNLSRLGTLNLGDNPGLAGPLPLTFTALSLANLNVSGTGLCASPDHGFQEWLRSLPFGRVPDCIRTAGQAMYLTQAVQSLDYPVPLVAGEEALLRVFLTSEDDQYPSMPPVRATFYHNNTTVHVEDIPGAPIPPPEETDEGSWSASINASVPGAVIMPELELVVEIDPGGANSLDSRMPVRIPPTGRMPVDVRDVPPLDLTLVPLLWIENPDRSILSEIEGLSPDDDLFWQTHNLLPVGDLSISIRDEVFISVDPVYDNYPAILSETRAIHILDGDQGHYMGVLRSGGGAALTGGRTFVSGLEGFTIAHELGHNMGLGHAPCGSPGLFTVDASYPYADGSVGAWGYDIRNDLLVPPDTKDLMSYCHPQWISDYSFIKALNYRYYKEAQQIPLSQPHMAGSLLLWGFVDESGQINLKPAFMVNAPVSLPAETGPYRLTGNSADGGTLFKLDFDMEKIADGEGGVFAFTVPMNADWLPGMELITLEGPEGTVSIDRSTGQPGALLLDRVTGRVRGILTDWIDADRNSTFTRSSLPDTGLEIVIIRGVFD